MTTRTITAMFKTRQDADQAGKALISQLGLTPAVVRISPSEGVSDTGYDANRPYEEKGFFGSLKEMLMPEEDRYAYAEGMRRGDVLLSATVDETMVDRAADVLEHHGALDLDEQEASWRKSGWGGYDSSAHDSMTTAAAAPMAAPNRPGMVETARGTAETARGMAETAPGQPAQGDTLKVVKERLVVGKRAVDQGRVKVRAYVVERPVEETVRLHEETIHVDRRPVDRVATDADMAAFQERTIEAHASREEAVVSKEARVVEEISLHKEAADREETVRDTVRETKVDVDDAGMTRTAQDGTPGNPQGTMVSRAVDKTLGTNVSGTNPDRR